MRIKFDLNDVDQHALWLEISLKKPHRISDRLCSNRCIKPHRIPGSLLHARAEEAGVERFCLLVNEKHWQIWSEQNERTSLRADQLRVKARSPQVGNRPRM